VILDGKQPVRDPAALKPGTHPMPVSATGKAAQRVSATVPASGLTRPTIPTLDVTPSRTDRHLPTATCSSFLRERGHPPWPSRIPCPDGRAQ
jgi:hypothetical protein